MGCVVSSKPQAVKNSSPEDIVPDQSIQATQLQSRDVNFSSGLIYTEAKGNNVDVGVLIFSAVKRGDIVALKSSVSQHFLDREYEVHQLKGMWDSTPLMVAIQYHHTEIIDYLFTFPPQDVSIFNHRNEKGASAVLFAVIEGLSDVVAKLVLFNVQVNLIPSTDSIYNPYFDQSAIATPLSMAVSNNQLAILKLLLAHGCDANERFEFPLLKSIASVATMKKLGVAANGTGGSKLNGIVGLSPILLSCHYGHSKIVKELLARKCDYHVKDGEGNSILHHLARAKGVASNNNNANTISETASSTAVEEATLHPAVEIFRLLQKDLIIDDSLLHCEDINGDTALHVAAENKQVEYIKLLLQGGCNPSMMNTKTGLTPLHIAVKKRCVAVIECLLQFGADPLIKLSDHPLNSLSPHDLSSKLTKTSEVYLIMEKAVQAWKSMRNDEFPNDAKSTEILSAELTITGTNTFKVQPSHHAEISSIALDVTHEKAIDLSLQLASNESITPERAAEVASPIKENTIPTIPMALQADTIESSDVMPFVLPSSEKVHEKEIIEIVNIAHDVEANEKKHNRTPTKQLAQSPNKAALVSTEKTSNKKQYSSNDIDKSACNDVSLIDMPEESKPSPLRTSLDKTDRTTEDQVSEFQVFNDSNNSFEYYDPLAYKQQTGQKKQSSVVSGRMDSYIKSYNPSLLLLAHKVEDDEATDVLKNQLSVEEEEDEKEFFQQEKQRRKRPSGSVNADDDSNLEIFRPPMPTNSIVAIAESIAADLPSTVESRENFISSATKPDPVSDRTSVSEPKITPTSFAEEVATVNGKENKSSVSDKRLIPKPPPTQATSNQTQATTSGNNLEANSRGGAGFRRRQNNSEKSAKPSAQISSQSTGNAVEKSKGEDIRTSEGTTTKQKLAPTAPAGKPKPPTNNQHATAQTNVNNADIKTSQTPNSATSTSLTKPSPLHRRKLVAKT